MACRSWRADGQFRGKERWTKALRDWAGQGWRRGRGGAVGCNTVSHARDEGGGAGDFEMPSKRKSRPRGRLCERRLCVPVEVRTASRRASDASDHQPAGRIVLPGCSNCISDSRSNGYLVSLPNNQIEHQNQRTIYQNPKQQCIKVFRKRRSHRSVVPQGTSQWITKPTASTRPPPVSLYRSV